MNETILAFGYPETFIKEYEHWLVLMRPKQITVGSLVLAVKAEAERLGDLKPEVWTEFADVSKDMEQSLINAFGAEKFNYLALMMKDRHVHFHLIPRYSQLVTVANETFTDPDWPLKTAMQPLDLNDSTWQIIQKTLLREV